MTSVLDWLDSIEGQEWLNSQHNPLRNETEFASIKDDRFSGPVSHWIPGTCVAIIGEAIEMLSEVSDNNIARPHP
jgi:hypothetical protein